MTLIRRFMLTVAAMFLAAVPSFAQSISTLPGQVSPNNSLVPAAISFQAGSITSSGLTATVQAGPVYCNGSVEYMAQSNFILPANTANQFVYFQCPGDITFVTTQIQQGTGTVNILLATLTTGASTVTTNTDLRSLALFPVVSDWSIWIPESACGGATTGTAGAGNATDIVATSGGARVFRLSATNASGSTNTFTCNFEVPTKTSTGKFFIPTDIVMLVSTQTTQPTSVTLPTVKTFTTPAAAGAGTTANSATFVTYGGTVTINPTSAQFAGLAAITAGQFYPLDIILGTPVILPGDLSQVQIVVPFVQSASAASLQEVPGLYVHGVMFPL